jgi:hypothetical protein
MKIGAYAWTVHRMMLRRSTVRQDDGFSQAIVARDHASRGFQHHRISLQALPAVQAPPVVQALPAVQALPVVAGKRGGLRSWSSGLPVRSVVYKGIEFV